MCFSFSLSHDILAYHISGKLATSEWNGVPRHSTKGKKDPANLSFFPPFLPSLPGDHSIIERGDREELSHVDQLRLNVLIPNHQRWHAEWKLSRNRYTMRARFFAHLGANSHAQSELNSKISASELSRNFIKS